MPMMAPEDLFMLTLSMASPGMTIKKHSASTAVPTDTSRLWDIIVQYTHIATSASRFSAIMVLKNP